MSEGMDDKELIEALCGLLGSGRADPGFVLPALRELGAKNAAVRPTEELLALLAGRPEPSVASLAGHLRARRRLDASRCCERKRSGAGRLEEFAEQLGDLPLDAPLGWTSVSNAVPRLKWALALQRDLFAAEASGGDERREAAAAAERKLGATDSPRLEPIELLERLAARPEAAELSVCLSALKERIRAFMSESVRRAREAFFAPGGRLPSDLDQEAAAHLIAEAFESAGSTAARRAAFDAACAWPTSRMAAAIRSMGAADDGLRERAALMMTLRFNEPWCADWAGVSGFLMRAEEQDARAGAELEALSNERPAELLLLWLRRRAEIPASAWAPIAAWCRARVPAWPEAPSKLAATLPPPVPAPAAAAAAPAPAPAPEPEASLWNEHVLPFLAENWGLLSGIAMVVAGSSLLAYYTWDKHWFVRYTVLPALLAGFTAVLARIGAWLEKRRDEFQTTADLLRGAAVALLPANFMAVALLARDPQVTYKEVLLPVAALIYLAGFGAALSRWCAAVHPSLKGLLGRTLLLVNALVLLGPAAQVLGTSPEGVRAALAAGFYAGFGLVAAAVVLFVRMELAEGAVADKRVPWFLGVSLASTYLQVFLWVYGFMGGLPRPETYALMVVASGGLVLFAEHASRLLRKDNALYGGPSFIGYALMLLGVFLGVSQPQVRLAALVLAGAIWLAQAAARRDTVHGWIAYTLLAVGAGSIGTWDAFPGPWIPGLALGVAAGAGALGAPLKGAWDGFEPISAGMQAAVLNASAVLAVLVQWHYGSAPLLTAGFLLAAAALFAWRAFRDRRVAYVHTVMAILAVALPYLGFADMSGRTLHGNNVVFGLAVLSLAWLAAATSSGAPLLLEARSAVLLVYGALALSAMLLRVAFEQGRPDNLLPAHAAMALSGPMLIAGALMAAAYFSRSLLPQLIAAMIVVVLAPQLRAEIERYLPFIHWGSGLMSGLSAAALLAACFPLRRAAFLKDLGEGDRFSAQAPFPLQRRDHTLFTEPLTAIGIFLALKVDTWNLAGHLAGDGVHLRTAAALVLAGLAWTLRAVYRRKQTGSRALVHCGWLSAVAGLAFGYYDLAPAPVWHEAVLLCGAFLNALYFFYRYGLGASRPWADDLLAAPVRRVLRAAAVAVSALVVLMLLGGDAAGLGPLAAASAAELAWLGLTDGDGIFGGMLFLHLWAFLLARLLPGTGALVDRLTVASAGTPSMGYLLAIQALYLGFEFAPRAEERARKLTRPIFVLASLSAFGLGLCGALDGLEMRLLSEPQAWLWAATVLAAARAQASGPLVLNGLVLCYLALLYRPLAALAADQARLDFLLSPWRLSALALTMSALAELGRRLRAWRAELVEGPYAAAFFRIPAAPWVRVPALLAAAYATAAHALDPVLRAEGIQLWAPYLSAAAFAVAGAPRGSAVCLAAACLCLGEGNIQAVRFHLGAYLRARGLMESHLMALGATATLAQLAALRGLSPRRDFRTFLNRAILSAAAFVLAVLTGTYFIQPGLEAMSQTRFLLSGAMAYLAGRCFQRAARRPEEGEAPYVELWEGLYHFGVTTAIWCAALLVPWFRHPNAAFPALGLPVVCFWLRAELAPRADVARYRNTAAALSFFMLVLYAFRGAFQLVLFPGAPIGLDHYHFNAPFVLALAVLMLRLRGLGGTDWLAFYGGLSMIAGSYFALTRWPGLSPFTHPIPSAWAVIGLGHFWLLFCSRPSPLRTFLRGIAAMEEELWRSLQSSWGIALLAATQCALAWGLQDYASDTFMVAPLLIGGATLLAHQGFIRRSEDFYVFAGLEAMAALHADFLVPSWLHREGVVWALLAIWAAALLLSRLRSEKLVARAAGLLALPLGAATLAQIFWHGPASDAGLWAFGGGAVLAALTPCESKSAACGLLWLAPTWLAYFSQCREAFPWPPLATAAAVLGTGAFAGWVEEHFPRTQPSGPEPLLIERTMALFGREGFALNRLGLFVSFALAAFVQAAHYDSAFAPRELAVLLGLYGAGGAAWYSDAVRRQAMTPYFMLQFCALAFAVVVRRQLMLTLHFWNYEYDVWVSLAVSYALAGAKQSLPLAPRQARIPLLGTLLTMPVAAMIWVLLHHLGTNTVLLVVGLYSLMFSYMGKDDRESPYHLIAVAGFVSFVLIVFWSKLELRVVQAYVIPVGLGVLALLQLLRGKIAPALRNNIRAVTLLAMLASAAYYALVDDRYPLAFHLTLLLLGVLAMSLGSFLRVRLYVLLGFAGVLTDLGAILYKVLIHMDRTSRMTLIGVQVLLLGAALIFGAVAYRTHREKLNETVDRWRRGLAGWE